MTQAIGWLSSLILLATIVEQIRTQIREHSQRGVSKWLFVGQTAASVGFTVYSALVRNWVFVVTNGALLMAGIVGLLITRLRQRQPRSTSNEGSRELRPAVEGQRK
jgi:uncharacterized protein with PQ loop repeat